MIYCKYRKVGGNENETLFDCSDVLFNRCSPAAAMCHVNGMTGFSFIPAPMNLGVEKIKKSAFADLIKEVREEFDYIIIDGSEELNNPVSSIGLTMSNKIVRVYKVCAKDCVWHKAMENLTDLIHIRSKTITVINGYDKSCDKMAFLNGLDTKPDFELPFVSNCPTLTNSGKLIYNSKLANGHYKKTIQKLASQVMLGG